MDPLSNSPSQENLYLSLNESLNEGEANESEANVTTNELTTLQTEEEKKSSNIPSESFVPPPPPSHIGGSSLSNADWQDLLRVQKMANPDYFHITRQVHITRVPCSLDRDVMPLHLLKKLSAPFRAPPLPEAFYRSTEQFTKRELMLLVKFTFEDWNRDRDSFGSDSELIDSCLAEPFDENDPYFKPFFDNKQAWKNFFLPSAGIRELIDTVFYRKHMKHINVVLRRLRERLTSPTNNPDPKEPPLAQSQLSTTTITTTMISKCAKEHMNPQQQAILAKRLDSSLQDPITYDYFSDPHITPCGHTFNFSSISQALERQKQCPIDRRPLSASQLLPNHFIKEIIEAISSEWNNCERLASRIAKAIKCPLTTKVITEPVLGPCGHTFDLSSITKGARCPHDNTKLSKAELITNVLAKDILDIMADPNWLMALAKTDLLARIIRKAEEPWRNDDLL